MQQPCFVKTSWFVLGGEIKTRSQNKSKIICEAWQAHHAMVYWARSFCRCWIRELSGSCTAMRTWKSWPTSSKARRICLLRGWMLHIASLHTCFCILYPDVSLYPLHFPGHTLQLWTDLWRHLKQVFSWWQCLSLPCSDLSGFHQVNSRITSLLLEVQHLDDSHVP